MRGTELADGDHELPSPRSVIQTRMPPRCVVQVEGGRPVDAGLGVHRRAPGGPVDVDRSDTHLGAPATARRPPPSAPRAGVGPSSSSTTHARLQAAEPGAAVRAVGHMDEGSPSNRRGSSSSCSEPSPSGSKERRRHGDGVWRCSGVGGLSIRRCRCRSGGRGRRRSPAPPRPARTPEGPRDAGSGRTTGCCGHAPRVGSSRTIIGTASSARRSTDNRAARRPRRWRSGRRAPWPSPAARSPRGPWGCRPGPARAPGLAVSA